MQFWFTKMLDLFIEALKQISNILYQIVFDIGPLGSALKFILDAICFILKIVLAAWNLWVCPMMKTVVAPILDFLVAIISVLMSLLGGLGQELIKPMQDMVQALYDLECNANIECGMPTSTSKNLEFGALPVATRCWADYSPEIDSTAAFSCTRSDTCRVSDLNYGTTIDYATGLLLEDGNQIVCDQCPLQPGNVVNSFGCDVYTKQCTCNRPKLERTYCTSNGECVLQGDAASMCALVGDFQTGESFGTLQCNQCITSQPVCLISGRDSSKGVCSCMLQVFPSLSAVALALTVWQTLTL